MNDNIIENFGSFTCVDKNKKKVGTPEKGIGWGKNKCRSCNSGYSLQNDNCIKNEDNKNANNTIIVEKKKEEEKKTAKEAPVIVTEETKKQSQEQISKLQEEISREEKIKEARRKKRAEIQRKRREALEKLPASAGEECILKNCKSNLFCNENDLKCHPKRYLGEDCENNSQCRTGSICLLEGNRKRCRLTDKKKGSYCQCPDGDCDDGKHCMSLLYCDNSINTCVSQKKGNGACNYDFECELDDVCVHNQCVRKEANLEEPCDINGKKNKCAYGLFCNRSDNKFNCKAKVKLGNTCQNDNQCEGDLKCVGSSSKKCSDLKLNSDCDKNNPCTGEPGLFCDLNSNICKYKLQINKNMNTRSAKCKVINDKTGETNCLIGKCLVDSCSLGKSGHRCEKTSDCDYGLYCSNKNECEKKKGFGGSCIENSESCLGECIDNTTCSQGGLGERCLKDGKCGDKTLTCKNNKCESKKGVGNTCGSDADCNSNATKGCKGKPNAKKCSDGSFGATCALATDCNAGLFCNDNLCSKKEVSCANGEVDTNHEDNTIENKNSFEACVKDKCYIGYKSVLKKKYEDKKDKDGNVIPRAHGDLYTCEKAERYCAYGKVDGNELKRLVMGNKDISNCTECDDGFHLKGPIGDRKCVMCNPPNEAGIALPTKPPLITGRNLTQEEKTNVTKYVDKVKEGARIDEYAAVNLNPLLQVCGANTKKNGKGIDASISKICHDDTNQINKLCDCPDSKSISTNSKTCFVKKCQNRYKVKVDRTASDHAQKCIPIKFICPHYNHSGKPAVVKDSEGKEIAIDENDDRYVDKTQEELRQGNEDIVNCQACHSGWYLKNYKQGDVFFKKCVPYKNLCLNGMKMDSQQELNNNNECKSCLPGFKKPDAEKKCMNCQQGYERNDYQADIDMNLYDDLNTKPIINNFEEKNGVTCMKDQKIHGVTHTLTVSNVAGENGEKINECQKKCLDWEGKCVEYDNLKNCIKWEGKCDKCGDEESNCKSACGDKYKELNTLNLRKNNLVSKDKRTPKEDQELAIINDQIAEFKKKTPEKQQVCEKKCEKKTKDCQKKCNSKNTCHSYSVKYDTTRSQANEPYTCYIHDNRCADKNRIEDKKGTTFYTKRNNKTCKKCRPDLNALLEPMPYTMDSREISIKTKDGKDTQVFNPWYGIKRYQDNECHDNDNKKPICYQPTDFKRPSNLPAPSIENRGRPNNPPANSSDKFYGGVKPTAPANLSPVEETDSGFNNYVYNLFNKAAQDKDGTDRPNIDGVSSFISNDNNNCVVSCKKGYRKDISQNTCHDCLDEDRKGIKTYVPQTCTATAKNGCYKADESNTNFPYLPGDEGPVAKLVQDLKNCGSKEKADINICFDGEDKEGIDFSSDPRIKEKKEQAEGLEKQISQGYIYAKNGVKNSTDDGGYCFSLCTGFLKVDEQDKSQCLFCENARLTSEDGFNQVGISPAYTQIGKDKLLRNKKIYMSPNKTKFIDEQMASATGLGKFVGGVEGWNKCQINTCPQGSVPVYNKEFWAAKDIPGELVKKAKILSNPLPVCNKTDVTTNCISYELTDPRLIADKEVNYNNDEGNPKHMYTKHEKKDTPAGKDIKNYTTAEACNIDKLKKECDKNSTCTNITILGDGNKCWLKDNKGTDLDKKLVDGVATNYIKRGRVDNKDGNAGNWLLSTNKISKLKKDITAIRNSKPTGSDEWTKLNILLREIVNFKAFNNIKQFNNLLTKCKNCWEIDNDIVMKGPDENTVLDKKDHAENIVFFQPAKSFRPNTCTISTCDTGYKKDKNTNRCIKDCSADGFEFDEENDKKPIEKANVCKIKCPNNSEWKSPEDSTDVDNTFYEKIRNFDDSISINPIKSSCKLKKGDKYKIDLTNILDSSCDKKDTSRTCQNEPWYSYTDNCVINQIFYKRMKGRMKGAGSSGFSVDGDRFVRGSPSQGSIKGCAKECGRKQKKDVNGEQLQTCEMGFSFKPWLDCYGTGCDGILWDGACWADAYEDNYNTRNDMTSKYPDYKSDMAHNWICEHNSTWTYVRKDMAEIDSLIGGVLASKPMKGCAKGNLKLIHYKKPKSDGTCEAGFERQIVEKRNNGIKKIPTSEGKSITNEKICNKNITSELACIRSKSFGKPNNNGDYEVAQDLVHEWMADNTSRTMKSGSDERVYWTCVNDNSNISTGVNLSNVIKGTNYLGCKGGNEAGQIKNFSGDFALATVASTSDKTSSTPTQKDTTSGGMDALAAQIGSL